MTSKTPKPKPIQHVASNFFSMLNIFTSFIQLYELFDKKVILKNIKNLFTKFIIYVIVCMEEMET